MIEKTNDSINISIIIPTFNRSKSLEKTLKSLFNQTYPEDKFEIIVCDGNSTDGTFELVKDLIEKSHSILRYIKQQDTGVASARNLGIKKARGNIIGFIDDDCIASSNWIESSIKNLYQTEIGGIQGCVFPDEYKKNVFKDIFYFKRGIIHLEDDGSYVTANMFYKKNVVIKAGCFDSKIKWGEDSDLAYRIKKMGYKIVFNKESIVYHSIKYIDILTYSKLLKNYEYFPLLVKKNPEIRQILFLKYVANKNHIYPIFLILFLSTNIFFNESNILLILVIFSYLWCRVIIDRKILNYFPRILAFPRNSIIDLMTLIYFIKGSIRYRTLVI